MNFTPESVQQGMTSRSRSTSRCSTEDTRIETSGFCWTSCAIWRVKWINIRAKMKVETTFSRRSRRIASLWKKTIYWEDNEKQDLALPLIPNHQAPRSDVAFKSYSYESFHLNWVSVSGWSCQRHTVGDPDENHHEDWGDGKNQNVDRVNNANCRHITAWKAPNWFWNFKRMV